jgi:hypothetical protein
MQVEQRILSAPHPVHWAGFQSTTTEMQQHGWQIAVEFEPMRLMYRLMFKHEQLRLYALTAQEHIQQGANGFGQMHDFCVPFKVCHAAASIECLRIHDDISMFRAIDATPVMVTESIERIEDLNIFNVSLRKAEEILVNEADMNVIDHLEAIKALQSEEQKIIRERMLKGVQPGELIETSGPQARVMANVISIAA